MSLSSMNFDKLRRLEPPDHAHADQTFSMSVSRHGDGFMNGIN